MRCMTSKIDGEGRPSLPLAPQILMAAALSKFSSLAQPRKNMDRRA